MKQSVQFWLISGLALCFIASVIPAQAKIFGAKEINSAANPVMIRASNPTLILHFIPAQSSIPERGMFLDDIRKLIAPACSAYRGHESSQFIITGRGGLPPSPSEMFRSDAALVDLGMPIQAEKNRARAVAPINSVNETALTQIVEAQGWVIDKNDQMVLTAQPTTLRPYSPWLSAANCHGVQTSS